MAENTIKFNELATKSTLLLTDLLAVSDSNGTLYKEDLQAFVNFFDSASGVSFKGSLAIADTPTLDGWYFASESGTYTNAGSLVVNITNNLVIIIVADTQTTFSKIDIPLSITFDSTPTLGSTNAVESNGIKVEFNSLDSTKKLLIGTNSDMSGANDWVAGIGSPTFDINTTVADKMFIDFTTGNQEVKIVNLLETGKRYEVRIKARLNSGSSMPIRIGAFVTTMTNNNAFDIVPTSTEQEFSSVIVASEGDFSIGALTATNIGSNFEITDVKVYDLSEQLTIIKNSLPNSVIEMGAVNNGLIDCTSSIQSYIDGNTSNNLELYFPSGTYLLGELTINGFNDVFIYGDNATIKANTGNTAIFNITNGDRVNVRNLFCDVNSINLSNGFFKVESIKDFAKFDKVDFKNFGHNTAYACKFERVADDSGIVGQETGIGVSFNNCNFYNNQVISLSAFNYATSTWLGRCIYLGQDCEYWRVVNCYFRCIHVAIETPDGANGTISACNISYTNSYDWSTSTSRGAVNILNTVDNNGKLIIDSCHFNHNYGVSIKSVYSSTGRPMQIINNQFIANAYTAIDINGQWKNLIHSNFFDRANIHVGLTNDPFTSNDSTYILLNDSSKNSIRNNLFSTGTELAHMKSTGTSDYNVVTDNLYTSARTLFDSVGLNNILRNNDNIL